MKLAASLWTLALTGYDCMQPAFTLVIDKDRLINGWTDSINKCTDVMQFISLYIYWKTDQNHSGLTLM